VGRECPSQHRVDNEKPRPPPGGSKGMFQNKCREKIGPRLEKVGKVGPGRRCACAQR